MCNGTDRLPVVLVVLGIPSNTLGVDVAVHDILAAAYCMQACFTHSLTHLLTYSLTHLLYHCSIGMEEAPATAYSIHSTADDHSSAIAEFRQALPEGDYSE